MGSGHGRSNVPPMAPRDRKNDVGRFVRDVAVIIVGAAAIATLSKVPAVANALGKGLSAIPLWVTLPVILLSLIGIVATIRTGMTLFQDKREDEHAKPEPEPRPNPKLEEMNPRRVEIDLRSSMPIVFVKSVSRQLVANIKVINHTPFAVAITEISIKVWFGQAIKELSTRVPRKLPPHSTGDDISITKILEASDAADVQDFLDRNEPSKQIYIDVTLVFDANGKVFDRFAHFERRLPEANAITLQ